MRIVWQILRKDARALRWYLALGAAASLVCGVMQGLGVAWRPGLSTPRESAWGWSGACAIVVCHLFWTLEVALAVRQDPLDGAADWRTRPVAWHTLLAAKVAFFALLVAPQIALRDLAAFVSAALPFDYGWRMAALTVARLAVLLLPVALWASLSTRALKVASAVVFLLFFWTAFFHHPLPSLWH